MEAPSEDAAIEILRACGYWSDPALWVPYGDNENNYSVVGNQQSSPDAALVERVVNAIDAVLMGEVKASGASPASSQEAVSLLFPDAEIGSDAGRNDQKRRVDVARLVQVSAMGPAASAGDPSIVVADRGEGISPDDFPDTILSLGKSNKLRVPYVQGKFNMGGSGSLKFSGRHGLQVIVSRRRPDLVDTSRLPEGADTSRETDWGVTVLRREDPGDGRRSSVYTYLAPVQSGVPGDARGVLSFQDERFGLMPDNEGNPFGTEVEYGTAVKMFDYQTTFKQQIPRQRSIKERLELLLARPALPFRVVECREHYWQGESPKIRSLAKTLVGVERRLEEDLASGVRSNVEHAGGGIMRVSGPDGSAEEVAYRVYLIRSGKGQTYRQSEGVVFTVGGQTQGSFSDSFFKRKAVGLSYLAKDLLVVVDGSTLSGRAREDLFMNSRDRLSETPLRYRIERALETVLAENADLARFRDLRRRAVEDARLTDEAPLMHAVQALVTSNPSLRRVLRTADPQRATAAILRDYGAEAERTASWAFEGKEHPSYLRFVGNFDPASPRRATRSRPVRVRFETDAVDDWISRRDGAAEILVEAVDLDTGTAVDVDVNVMLSSGKGEVTVSAADGGQLVPDTHEGALSITFSDPMMQLAWSQGVPVTGGQTLPADVAPDTHRDATPEADREPDAPHPDRRRPADRELRFPEVVRVREKSTEARPATVTWADLDPPFDSESALRVVDNGLGGYDFYVNLDNVYIRAECRLNPEGADVIETRYVYALILMGMSMLRRVHGEDEDAELSQEDLIERTTSDVAPVLIPMIEALSNIEGAAVEVA